MSVPWARWMPRSLGCETVTSWSLNLLNYGSSGALFASYHCWDALCVSSKIYLVHSPFSWMPGYRTQVVVVVDVAVTVAISKCAIIKLGYCVLLGARRLTSGWLVSIVFHLAGCVPFSRVWVQTLRVWLPIRVLFVFIDGSTPSTTALLSCGTGSNLSV
jgi:hypothetical protein